jgi:hypothetical protein
MFTPCHMTMIFSLSLSKDKIDESRDLFDIAGKTRISLLLIAFVFSTIGIQRGGSKGVENSHRPQSSGCPADGPSL